MPTLVAKPTNLVKESTMSPLQKFFSRKGRVKTSSKGKILQSKLTNKPDVKVETSEEKLSTVQKLPSSKENRPKTVESTSKIQVILPIAKPVSDKLQPIEKILETKTEPVSSDVDVAKSEQVPSKPTAVSTKEKDPDFVVGKKSSKSKKKKIKKAKKQEIPKSQPLITAFLRRSSRVPTGEKRKQEEERLHAYLTIKEDDELSHLVVKTTEEKGRGIYANMDITKGKFIVEYAGDLMTMEDGVIRETEYTRNPEIGCYIYFFEFSGKRYCIDATAESGRYGRLLNHSKTQGNCKTRLVEHPEGIPRLIIEAKRDIKKDEELTYDYGDRNSQSIKNHPWLKN